MSHEQSSLPEWQAQAAIADLSQIAYQVWEYLDEYEALSADELRDRFGRFPRKAIRELDDGNLLKRVRTKQGLRYAILRSEFTLGEEAA